MNNKTWTSTKYSKLTFHPYMWPMGPDEITKVIIHDFFFFFAPYKSCGTHLNLVTLIRIASVMQMYLSQVIPMCAHSTCLSPKTCLYNFDPLKPYFYIVKLGFTGVYIIFLIFCSKNRLWVLIRTASLRQF